ncbi:hypothetical protein ScPMuIL_004549 [Solemya velum]
MSKVEPEPNLINPGEPATYNPGPLPGPPPGPPAGPPPAYGFNNLYGQHSTTIVQQPVVTLVQRFTATPVHTVCPTCRSSIVTSTEYEVGTFAWIAAAIIFFLGFWLFCCLIPFCLNDCKDVVHTCPSCHAHIGRYNRL